MASKAKWLAVAAFLAGGAASSLPPLPVRLETRSALNSRLANIHLEFDRTVLGDETVTFSYGSCQATSQSESHHIIARAEAPSTADRLVWRIPEYVTSGGCISAWTDGNVLVGRSQAQDFDHHVMRRRSILAKRAKTPLKRRTDGALVPVKMNYDSGIDAHGPWFEGVAFLADKNVSAVDVERSKAKKIAIVGAGMAGLMTYLVLTQAGFKNLSIIEAGHRLGGRVRTEYLSGGPFDYSYQEMGPMRFPHLLTFGNETMNISDHQLVFQLAAEMNKLNGNDRNLSVDLIPWIQNSPNGLVYNDGFKLPTGLPPTVAQIAANASLGSPPPVYDEEALATQTMVNSALPGIDFYKLLAENSFKAYKAWISTWELNSKIK